MISRGKFLTFVLAYLVVFAVVPGFFADFERVPLDQRWIAVAACLLFIAGVLLGARALPDGPAAQAMADEGAAASERRGLWTLSAVLVAVTAFIVVVGPHPPILAASEGADALAVALIREEAIKLNEDALFVRVYSEARDLLGPIAFTTAVAALVRPRGQRLLMVALLNLALALFIGLWSGQKATVVNYVVASVLFLARDTRQLVRMMAVVVPVLAALVIALFAFTYEGYFASDDTEQVQESVVSGLVERVFYAPFEVSLAYVDAQAAGLIQTSDALPIVGGLIAPNRPTLENTVGVNYFFSGIESVSANGLSFAYAYVIGGLPMSFIGGLAVPLLFGFGLRLVRGGRVPFLTRCYAAYLLYLLLDLLNGNVLSYLMRGAQAAVLLWGLACLVHGLASLRLPAAPREAAP